MRGGDDAQGPLEFVVDDRVEEADRLHLVQSDALHAAVAGDVQEVHVDDRVLAGRAFVDFDADDGAGLFCVGLAVGPLAR